MDGGGAGGAEGTLGWFPHFGGEVEEAEEGVVSVGYGAAAAVDEETDTDDDATGFLDDIDDLLNRIAGGDDIFDDEDAFTRFDMEAAAQRHDALFTFREDSPRTECLADFMSQQDAAGHRTHDGLDVLVLETFCQFFAELFRIFRMLENVELFNVQRAVQARRQEEMTFENGFRFY